MKDIGQRIERLREEIRAHDRLYYVENAPQISDRDYDRLMSELATLEKAHPECVTPDSPTQRVAGEPLEGFRTVAHAVPMLSIDNTYDRAALDEFDRRVREAAGDERFTYAADPKIDGVAANLRYEKGQLVLVVTRGDGQSGDDITSNARTIKSIPLALPRSKVPEVLEVRGEIYWPLSHFTAYNRHVAEDGGTPLANPRNGAAGTLKQLDPRVVARRKLAFIAHGYGEMSSVPVSTDEELFSLFRVLGLPVNSERKICRDLDAVWDAVQWWRQRRAGVDYGTDGMVIKVNELDLRRRMGHTSKYPRWCIAYKYETEQGQTVLREVVYQVGRSGVVTPVARLDPVQLGGTTVSSASMHNFDQVRRLDVRPGDTIVIEKAGEIIPQVVRILPEKRQDESRPIRPPETCPECSTTLQRDEGGVYIRCPNPSCPAQLRHRVAFFAGRNQMDIGTLGRELVAQLVDRGLVRHVTDLYVLDPEQVEQLDRMGAVSTKNLMDAVEASKDRGLARVLAALGIRHVGSRAAELLAEHFTTVDALAAADVEEITAVNGIGEKIASAVCAFFQSPEGQMTVARLKEAGVRLEEETRQAAGPLPLAGTTVVVTGTLERFSRAEAESAVRAAGGKPVSGVSGTTDFVVAGENPGARKVDKARELGVPVVSEDEFVRRLGGDRDGEDGTLF